MKFSLEATSTLAEFDNLEGYLEGGLLLQVRQINASLMFYNPAILT